MHLTRPKVLQVVAVYKSLACDTATFNSSKMKLTPSLDLNSPFVIMGDFNYDLVNKQQGFLTFMVWRPHSTASSS